MIKKKTWEELSIREKSEMMKVAIRNGITGLDEIKAKYNEFAQGRKHTYQLHGMPVPKDMRMPMEYGGNGNMPMGNTSYNDNALIRLPDITASDGFQNELTARIASGWMPWGKYEDNSNMIIPQHLEEQSETAQTLGPIVEKAITDNQKSDFLLNLVFGGNSPFNTSSQDNSLAGLASLMSGNPLNYFNLGAYGGNLYSLGGDDDFQDTVKSIMNNNPDKDRITHIVDANTGEVGRIVGLNPEGTYNVLYSNGITPMTLNLPEFTVLGGDAKMRATRNLDAPLMGGELKDNQYRTQPTNEEASHNADLWAAQTSPGIGDFIGAALKPLDATMPNRWVGLLDSDNQNGMLHLFDDDNRGFYINNDPNGIFSKKFHDEHPYLAMVGNALGDVVTGYGAAKTLQGTSYLADKTINTVIDLYRNWRPWVPSNANRYYRIVGKAGDPIGDAIKSGVIRGPGANPDSRAALQASMKDRPITLVAKAHNYPMFSKGQAWKGSNSRVDTGKPIVIRSKADTRPIVWEESNVDFNHKGHAGIFRPSYYGDVNASPTQFFEWWEPKKLGYMRREFPKSNNPYSNFMGNGYKVDRGWWESDLGITGARFGEYIGSGGEQTVFEDAANPNQVLKVYNDTYRKTLDETKELVSDLLERRNTVPLQEPINFVGIVDDHGYPYPVFSQAKLTPLGSMPSVEFKQKYIPLLQKELAPLGYTGDGISSNFSNGLNTLLDIKPENMGISADGRLRFFDVDIVNNE